MVGRKVAVRCPLCIAAGNRNVLLRLRVSHNAPFGPDDGCHWRWMVVRRWGDKSLSRSRPGLLQVADVEDPADNKTPDRQAVVRADKQMAAILREGEKGNAAPVGVVLKAFSEVISSRQSRTWLDWYEMPTTDAGSISCEACTTEWKFSVHDIECRAEAAARTNKTSILIRQGGSRRATPVPYAPVNRG